MDRAFGGDGTSVPSADSMQEAATCLYFPADLRESSTQYKFLIDLPGVPKSDIKVCVVSTLPAGCCSAWFLDVLILTTARFDLQWFHCHNIVLCASWTPVLPCILCHMCSGGCELLCWQLAV